MELNKDFRIGPLDNEIQKDNTPEQQKLIPKHPFRLLLSGQSGSGKTLLLLNLLLKPEFYRGFFRYIVVISPNFDNDKQYDNLKKFIMAERVKAKKDKRYKPVRLEHYEKFNEGELDALLEELSEARAELGDDLPPTLFLLDDVIDDKKLINSTFFSMLGTRSRHFNASVIIATQSYKRVARTTRLNMSNVIFFKPSNESEKKRIYEEIITDCNYKQFSNLCDAVFAKKYSFIVVNVNKTDDRLYINFEYKVKPRPNRV